MKSDPLPSKKIETLESMKERFSTKLTDILYEKLTVDNIETFADDALDNIIDLTSNILDYYKNSGNLEVHTELELKDQEDDAYTQLGLPKISIILDLIEEKKNEIDKIKDKINKEYIDTVITPPQENNVGIIPGNEKGFEKKKMIPRLLTLMYILENDLEIDLENVNVSEGNVYDNMMRQTPYVRVEVSDLERLVYICDEEGNVSYVFDTEKLKDKRISPEELDIDNKGDKNSLIKMHPGIGVRVVQIKNWRDKMKGYLEDEIPEVGVAKNTLGEIEEFESEKIESEFKKREKKVFLPYEEWIKELKNAYEKDKDFEGNFRDWYHDEAKKHTGWPMDNISIISKKYKVSKDDIYNAIGYTRKIFYQETTIPYVQFIKELKDAFEKDKEFEGDFNTWYINQAKKHKGWVIGGFSGSAKKYNVPMDDIYRAIGYKKKKVLQKNILPYDEWVKELKKVYTENKNFDGSFESWYIEEAKKHKGWLRGSTINLANRYNVSMDDIYNEIGYSRKIIYQESFLTYDQFIKELKDAFEKDKEFEGRFQSWYSKQAKKHKGWITDSVTAAAKKYNVSTDDIYNKIGYIRKTTYQESFLPYDQFIKELKDAFEKDKGFEGRFHSWYINQAKKHKGWITDSISAAAKKFNVSTNDIYNTIGYIKKK